MSDNLVERAKEAAANAPNRDLLFDLAAHIEALEAENARLREALEEVVVEYYKDDNGRTLRWAVEHAFTVLKDKETAND